MLFTTTLLIVRNQRILATWNTPARETQRRAAAGLPPRTRRRRRKTLASLAATGRPSAAATARPRTTITRDAPQAAAACPQNHPARGHDYGFQEHP